MFQLGLIVASILFCLGGSSALICHCFNNVSCDPVTYSCPGGCEKGWYGPGCQIGNVALKKPAFQSSTYSSYIAQNAVNGLYPPEGDETENQCSHTAQSNREDHWWYVNLSDSEDFVIKNITIVNRQGINAQGLRMFYILYTNNVTSVPDPKSWKPCAFIGPFQRTTVASYTCENGTAIGRRVAVYLVAGPVTNYNAKLTLCEVYVDGYSYDATSTLKQISTTATSTCENIEIRFSTQPIVPPTNLLVQLRENSSSTVTYVKRIRNTMNDLRSLTISSMASRSYIISVAPEICCIGSQCLENYTLDNSKCITGPYSIPVMVTIPIYRQYELRRFGEVVSIIALDDGSCFSINKTVHCYQYPADTSSANCSSIESCEFDPRYCYKCTLKVYFSDGFSQTSLENFNITNVSCLTTLQEQFEVKSDSQTMRAVIGGSVAGPVVLICVVVVTVALLLKRRNMLAHENHALTKPNVEEQNSVYQNGAADLGMPDPDYPYQSLTLQMKIGSDANYAAINTKE